MEKSAFQQKMSGQLNVFDCYLVTGSSPYYPQSNGKAERGVGIVKGLLNKAKEAGDDTYLALLAYRQAPSSDGLSLAEKLMGRKLHSRLPYLQRATNAESSCTENQSSSYSQTRQERAYNEHARDLPCLKVKDTVRLQDEKRTWSLHAQVLGEVAPRSYKVVAENGIVLRRKLDVKDSDEKADLDRDRALVPSPVVLRRSSRVSKSVDRLVL